MSRGYTLTNPRRTSPEKDEERKARRLMEPLGFTCWHLSQARASHQTPGWPDMLFTHLEKRLAVYYEAKRASGKQSPAQKEFQRHIEATGGKYVSGTADALILWCQQHFPIRVYELLARRFSDAATPERHVQMSDERKTVFLVSEGSYSDYSVRGVFSSRANAEEFIAFFKSEYRDDWNPIEEMELDSALPQLRAGLQLWNVTMLRDGSTERVAQSDITASSATSAIEPPALWERTKAPAYRGKGIPDAMQATVFAMSAEHAVKIANEKRTQMIAEGRWPSSPPQKRTE